MGSSGRDNNGSRSVGVTDVDLGARGQITVDAPLVYGEDTGKGQLPKSLLDFENKRRTAKIEFSILTMANGDVVSENRGGKHSVGASRFARMQADLLSHNHPRGDKSGKLGGTFSEGDIQNFLKYNQQTYRAVASEGTYSITKSDRLLNSPELRASFSRAVHERQRDFTATFNQRVADIQRQYDGYIRGINSQLRDGTISLAEHRSLFTDAYNNATAESTNAFNSELVRLHQWYIDNQSTYGYTYGLER